jgi:probable HAF family extracellular repeat protein
MLATSRAVAIRRTSSAVTLAVLLAMTAACRNSATEPERVDPRAIDSILTAPPSVPGAIISASGVTDLGTLGGAPDPILRAMNDAGQVAGWAYQADNVTYRAFRWSAGTMVGLSTLGGRHGAGADINASGEVAGWAQTTPGSTTQRAVLWRADGTPIGIGGGMAREGVRFLPETRKP